VKNRTLAEQEWCGGGEEKIFPERLSEKVEKLITNRCANSPEPTKMQAIGKTIGDWEKG